MCHLAFVNRWMKGLGRRIVRLHPLMIAALFVCISLGQGFYFWQRKEEIEMAQMTMGRLIGKTELFQRQQQKLENWHARHDAPDPDFVRTALEAHRPLQQERAQLEEIVNHPALFATREVRNRLTFLQGTENRIVFLEERRMNPVYGKESELRLVHPVEIDRMDLAYLLDQIEGLSAIDAQHRPELIPLDFSLRISEGHIFWDVRLVKRE